jgi:hypothetical protein
MKNKVTMLTIIMVNYKENTAIKSNKQTLHLWNYKNKISLSNFKHFNQEKEMDLQD